eukprot:m.124718 g.124718  ORF g.124718 m.124718 type:complete len:63 (-) comp23429_c0_seq2:112-300(-)
MFIFAQFFLQTFNFFAFLFKKSVLAVGRSFNFRVLLVNGFKNLFAVALQKGSQCELLSFFRP